MPRPRVRYDGSGKPLPCKVFVPPHLAQYLYRAAAAARAGKGGLIVDETEIVLDLIKKWAESTGALTWESVLADLKKEEEEETPSPPKGKGKKK